MVLEYKMELNWWIYKLTETEAIFVLPCFM